ncbi:hypothetical protein HDU96_011044 [Phlyctochytrium bullatum]|nr:hypothetical protein HDU96_011044 [Phlyctochytrium bullatum]
MTPTIIPALSTPTLGQPSFPIELLRCILLHVLPKDLPTVAAANRHLRSAVATCIDFDMAQHHLSQTSAQGRLKPADGPPESHLDHIPFNHPLLRSHHSVAALCLHGISEPVASQMWGRSSAYQVWEQGGLHSVSLEARALSMQLALLVDSFELLQDLPLLIKAGANIDEVCPASDRPTLSTAFESTTANWEVIVLLDAGASLNVSCRQPPFHSAVRNHDKDFVNGFLDAGALVNFPDEDGKTPLHNAMLKLDPYMYKEVEIPLLLLEYGADPTIRAG